MSVPVVQRRRALRAMVIGAGTTLGGLGLLPLSRSAGAARVPAGPPEGPLLQPTRTATPSSSSPASLPGPIPENQRAPMRPPQVPFPPPPQVDIPLDPRDQFTPRGDPVESGTNSDGSRWERFRDGTTIWYGPNATAVTNPDGSTDSYDPRTGRRFFHADPQPPPPPPTEPADPLERILGSCLGVVVLGLGLTGIAVAAVVQAVRAVV